MELRYRREAAVGVLLVVAAALFVFLMLWLRGRSFRSGELVTATFTDVAGLREGDPVRTSGVNVGNVRRVVLVGPGRVTVQLDVHGSPGPRADASAMIRSLDLFGARYVEYSPGTAGAAFPEGRPLQGVREQDLSEIAAGFSGQGREVLANATDLLAPSTTSELRAVLRQAQATLVTLQRAPDAPTTQLTAALAEVRRISQRVEILLARTTDPATATMRNMERITGNLTGVTATLTHTTATLDSLLTRVNSGRGVVGQLVNDTALVGELRRTNNALNDLLTDIKANPSRYFRLRL